MQHPQEVGQGHVVARYVAGERRYLELLGGNFLRLAVEARAAFVDSLQADSLQASDQEIRALLGYEWRSRLTAAWLVGVARRLNGVNASGTSSWPANSPMQVRATALRSLGSAPRTMQTSLCPI
ncbi:DUF6000 family protein [Streptomyces sp. SP17BM10]|uniref:DUF6000 family protein n=1 Tax=Streptomyces sp. SP17BM10 TaxID=3002530 RepID=UPI002E789470|nr:DUF6000 family protein [Streptomyces sp. SP17BM10]